MVTKQLYKAPDCEQHVSNWPNNVFCASMGVADSSFNDLDLITGEIE